jgi:hypothetical protein
LELTEQSVYDYHCEDAGNMLCIISFLPNIYDSSAAERYGYLKILKESAFAERKKSYKWFWLQAGDQLELERELQLGSGFPALVAITYNKNRKRKLIATMRTSFTFTDLHKFTYGLYYNGD